MADKASNWIPLTNEKLFFAQVILSYYQTEQQKQSTFGKNTLAGLAESAIAHLYNAYTGLLCELAAEHNLVFQPESITLNELNESLMTRDNGRRDIAELLALVEDQNSWLSGLLSRYRNRFISKQQKSEYKAEEPQLINAISVQSVEDAHSEFDIQAAYQSLKALVESIRSYRIED
ncbi:DUF6586 family protein [Litoribacillus peritrichatus]|uniref:PasA protein n=1 Tax=Litoribacillus peritrichatus TaxID=718191 RepID=A0ABP7LZV2_9GAMM